MKKYFVLLTFLVLAACSEAPVQAPSGDTVARSDAAAPKPESSAHTTAPAPWLENTHYEVLTQAASETPIVQEFFSFWCPHCHKFEPIVALVKEQLDSDTKFEKVHVDFMGFTTQDIQHSATKAMLMARHMGNEDSINSAIFQHIHVDQKEIAGMADIKPLFLANGMSSQAFDNSLALAEVDQLIEDHYETFMLYRPNITGVPSFIVNGKYKVKFTNEMNVNDMVNLIVWLTSK